MNDPAHPHGLSRALSVPALLHAREERDEKFFAVIPA